MPLWSDRAPDQPRGYGLEIIRTPQNKPLVAIATSRNLIGCQTHWWKGRTLPCERPNCEACSAGMPWRWHAYLAVWLPATAEHRLFETTAAASDSFAAYRSRYGTLRGCKFRATRTSTSKTGRIKIETCPANLEQLRIPEEPDLVKVLSVLWNLPEQSLTTRRQKFAETEIRVNSPADLIEEFAAIELRIANTGPAAAPQNGNGQPIETA